MQRSFAVVLMFMFWNGYTDIYWLAPSLLLDPLQLFLWFVLIWNYRSQVKSLPYVWLLGAGVLFTNLFQYIPSLKLLAQAFGGQYKIYQISIIGKAIATILFTSSAWYLVLRILLQNNPKQRLYLRIFLLLLLPSLLLPDFGLFFAGMYMLVFILKSKERQPFDWFILLQIVSFSVFFAQFVYHLVLMVS